MAGKKRKRSHLGRRRAKGHGTICVMVRRSAKKGHAHTKCFKSSKSAHTYLMHQVSGKAGHKVKSALIYKKGRAARAAR